MKRFMTTKMAMSVLVITVALAMVGMGTFALFTDSATSENNTFKAGSVDIGLGSITANIAVTNMAPGGPVSSYTVPLSNSGTLDVDWTATKTLVSTPADDGDGHACFMATGPTDASGTLASGALVDITGTVYMPIDADSDCEGATATLTIDVNAQNDL